MEGLATFGDALPYNEVNKTKDYKDEESCGEKEVTNG